MKRGKTKRSVMGSNGTFRMKGPMERQHLRGEGIERGSNTKGREHWKPVAQ